MLVSGPELRRLCEARDVLCAVDEPAPSIREVARHVRMSPYHFIRRFEALFGETPHQLRIRARVERAKQLLVLGFKKKQDFPVVGEYRWITVVSPYVGVGVGV